MPLSLDAIRNFAGNDRILVDARTGTVQSENKLQRFKSFFDIGDARQRNAETLSMIHHAFLNDPRFASRDLQSAAVRMLAQVRTDRAIGAAQLRGIADELFRLSGEGAGNGVDAVIRERVALHLAARGLPPLLDGIRERVVAFVADRIAADANVLAHPGSADVAGMANDLVDLCCAAARELQNGPRGVPDPRLLSVFGDNLGELLTDHSGAVRPDQDIADRLGRVRDFFQAAVDRAEQTG